MMEPSEGAAVGRELTMNKRLEVPRCRRNSKQVQDILMSSVTAGNNSVAIQSDLKYTTISQYANLVHHGGIEGSVITATRSESEQHGYIIGSRNG